MFVYRRCDWGFCCSCCAIGKCFCIKLFAYAAFIVASFYKVSKVLGGVFKQVVGIIGFRWWISLSLCVCVSVRCACGVRVWVWGSLV